MFFFFFFFFLILRSKDLNSRAKIQLQIGFFLHFLKNSLVNQCYFRDLLYYGDHFSRTKYVIGRYLQQTRIQQYLCDLQSSPCSPPRGRRPQEKQRRQRPGENLIVGQVSCRRSLLQGRSLVEQSVEGELCFRRRLLQRTVRLSGDELLFLAENNNLFLFLLFYWVSILMYQFVNNFFLPTHGFF